MLQTSISCAGVQSPSARDITCIAISK
jgi:hypothetical protein